MATAHTRTVAPGVLSTTWGVHEEPEPIDEIVETAAELSHEAMMRLIEHDIVLARVRRRNRKALREMKPKRFNRNA